MTEMTRMIRITKMNGKSRVTGAWMRAMAGMTVITRLG